MAGVTQDVERDRLLPQRWACLHGDGHVRSKPTFQCIAAQRLAGVGRKDRIGLMATPLVEPAPKHRDHRRGERRDPLLASFADAADMRSDAQMDVGFLKRDQLGRAKSRLHGQRE